MIRTAAAPGQLAGGLGAERDTAGMLFTAEMYGVQLDQLATALAVSDRRAAGIAARWAARGHAEAGRLGPGPRWVWLTRAGLTACGLPYAASPPALARLAHLRAVTAARLALEAVPAYREGGAHWRSERRLRARLGSGLGRREHLPDAEIHWPDKADPEPPSWPAGETRWPGRPRAGPAGEIRQAGHAGGEPGGGVAGGGTGPAGEIGRAGHAGGEPAGGVAGECWAVEVELTAKTLARTTAIMRELLTRTGDYGGPAAEARVRGRPARHARVVYLCAPAAVGVVGRARAALGADGARVEIRLLPPSFRGPGPADPASSP